MDRGDKEMEIWLNKPFGGHSKKKWNREICFGVSAAVISCLDFRMEENSTAAEMEKKRFDEMVNY